MKSCDDQTWRIFLMSSLIFIQNYAPPLDPFLLLKMSALQFCPLLIWCKLSPLPRNLSGKPWTRLFINCSDQSWCAKKAYLVWLKKLQGVQQITRLKQRFFIFLWNKRSYEKIICIYFLFHWFSGRNCIKITFSLHKGQQTLTD